MSVGIVGSEVPIILYPPPPTSFTLHKCSVNSDVNFCSTFFFAAIYTQIRILLLHKQLAFTILLFYAFKDNDSSKH